MKDAPHAGRTVTLPWGAWIGRSVELAVAPDWRIADLAMSDANALSLAEIGSALDRPVGSDRIEALAQGKRSAVIAVDDITRPTRTASVLALLVERLLASGLDRRSITVIIATGAHRPATPADVALKLGSLASQVRVISHDPTDNLVDTGVSLAGVAVRINREFANADLRIGIGGVMPHPFAGFSGGGKIVLPGLSDLDAVVRSHKYALMGFAGGLALDGNRFRNDMERAVRSIGLHFAVNVVLNSRCEVAAITAGDFVESHRAAVRRAQAIGATEAPVERLDLLVLNAYPKDSELLQVEAALVAVRAGMIEWLKDEAPLVLIAACPEGLGSHRLFGPGGRLFRKPAAKSYLGSRQLHVVSPAVEEDATHAAFWDGYKYWSTWESCRAALVGRLPHSPLVGVARCGPLHLPVSRQSTAPLSQREVTGAETAR